MLDFLANNWGSLAAGAIVIALVVLVLVNMLRDKKKGKSVSCAGCTGCAYSGHCASCGHCASSGHCGAPKESPKA